MTDDLFLNRNAKLADSCQTCKNGALLYSPLLMTTICFCHLNLEESAIDEKLERYKKWFLSYIKRVKEDDEDSVSEEDEAQKSFAKKIFCWREESQRCRPLEASHRIVGLSEICDYYEKD